MRVYEWGLRSAAKLSPWVACGVLLALIDALTPPHWGVSVLHMAIVLIAFQFLARRHIPRLIVSLVALSVLPYFSRPPLAFEPVRLWVPLGMLCAAYYHNDSQRRRKRRLIVRKQLQRSMRRRAIQVRRINDALRREISRRQATQQRLNQTETHLQSLAQRMQLQVIRKDIEGVITYANEAFCRGIGRSVNDVIGSTDADLYPPALADAYRLDDERVLRSGEAVDHIESHPTPDGKTGWVQVFKAPEYDEKNEIIGIQMVFWDVTDSYRKTAELRRSEARKRALFDAAREAVLLVDDQGLVVEANPAAESMLSTGDRPLAGHRLIDIAVPESSLQGLGDEPTSATTTDSDSKFAAGELGRGLDRRRPTDPIGRPALQWSDLPHGQRREIVLRPAGERNFPAEVSVHPIPLENSIGLAIFIRDVTLRHHALAALREAKSAAEDASRIKSEFMASVSHEIRTPLGGITGSAELLSQMELPPKAQQYVEMIRHSGALLTSVIGDILDLASIEAGRLQITPEPTDLHRCVGEAFRFLATRAMGKDVELILDIRPDVPRRIIADANRLRQIVINLAGNAIKFTPQGHVMLKVSVLENHGQVNRTAADMPMTDALVHPLLQLEMIDSGIGIAPDRVAKIFEPFEQGDSGTTRRFGGTGLGLSISDQLVRRMGGSIEVTSEPGHGSTFRCLLPLVLADHTADSADVLTNHSQAGQSLTGNPAACGTLTQSAVAVEIHHPIQRRAIIDLLVANGFNIDPEATTRVIDGLADRSQISLHARPPIEDSVSLAADHRRSDDATKLPRIIWLARVDDATPDDQLPNQPVLLKPVIPDDLLHLLRNDTATLSDRLINKSSRRMFATPQASATALGETVSLLLVDDSPVNQAVIRDFLTGAGYHVDLASSGQEAINAAESRRYACVLMDLQMPGMDGIEAMRLMILQDQRRELTSPPFIALTAHATDDHRQRCLSHGMKAFLVKPIDRQALIQTVDTLVTETFPLAAENKTHSPRLEANEPVDKWENHQEESGHKWRARLLKAAGNDTDTASSLVEAFLEEVPQLCADLNVAIDTKDFVAAHRAAHTLKSCLKYVAEPVDWKVAEDGENAAVQGDLDTIKQLAPEMIAIAQRWVDLLKA